MSDADISLSNQHFLEALVTRAELLDVEPEEIVDGISDIDNDGWENILDHGADPLSLTDSSAAILAAFVAAGSGGTVFAPDGTYLCANITLPSLQRQTLRGSSGAIFKKNANGPVFTTPGAGWGLNLEFIHVAIDGNGENFSGAGIAVGTSSVYFKFSDGRILLTRSNCIDFTANGSGAQSRVQDCILSVYQGQAGEANELVGAIKLPNDTTSSGNRVISNVQTDSNMLIDDLGSENTTIEVCVARNIVLSNAAAAFPKKMKMLGTRLASAGAEVAVRGTQNAFDCNVFGGNLVLEASASNGAYTGNVIAGDLLADAGTSNNQIYGNRPSGSVVDSGTNIFLRAEHVAAATPTGGASGDIKVGTSKIWVNDAGAWKSVAIA